MERAQKLEKYWDDTLAEYYYRLVYTYPSREDVVVASGNAQWAKNQARHYKLKINSEEE